MNSNTAFARLTRLGRYVRPGTFGTLPLGVAAFEFKLIQKDTTTSWNDLHSFIFSLNAGTTYLQHCNESKDNARPRIDNTAVIDEILLATCSVHRDSAS